MRVYGQRLSDTRLGYQSRANLLLFGRQSPYGGAARIGVGHPWVGVSIVVFSGAAGVSDELC